MRHYSAATAAAVASAHAAAAGGTAAGGGCTGRKDDQPGSPLCGLRAESLGLGTINPHAGI